MSTGNLYISVSNNSFSSLYHAFVMANAGLALGKEVVMFFGSLSVEGLHKDYAGDKLPKEVSSYLELRDSASELGVEILACDAGLKMAGIKEEELCKGCKVAGAVGFLATVGDHPILGV